MDAGSYWASFPAPASHLPLAKTTELCRTLFHSCRLPFPSEFAHFLFQFLIKLKQKAAKKGENANYTATPSLHHSLSFLCLLVPPSPLPLSELDWCSASSLWNHLPATTAGGENISSSSCTLKRKTAATHVEKANQTLSLCFALLDEAL